MQIIFAVFAADKAGKNMEYFRSCFWRVTRERDQFVLVMMTAAQEDTDYFRGFAMFAVNEYG